MTSLPTYEEAIRPAWIQLAAPYIIAPRDLQALCLVNKAFCDVCRPLLWERPLRTACQAGLLRKGLAWWLGFVRQHLPTVCESTRELPKVLDARAWLGPINHQGLTENPKDIERSFKQAFQLFPSLSCVVLDGIKILDITHLFSDYLFREGISNPIRLLSLVGCRYEIRCINDTAFENLVYLDISGATGGSIHAFIPNKFPKLRVLKIRDREVNNKTLQNILEGFSGQLWSLDVSNNKLTDEIVDYLIDSGFNPEDLRESQDQEEPGNKGSLTQPSGYLADPPAYEAWHPLDGYIDHLAWRRRPSRSTGVSPMQRDDLHTMLRKLSGDLEDWTGVMQAPVGLTHLNLSGNRFTSKGIERLLRNSRGHLESFACDVMMLNTLSDEYPLARPRSKLYGCLGITDALRPATSVNLRELCIHHSLVTQIPTFEAQGWPSLSKIHYAETSALSLPSPNAPLPSPFVPDTNPRLTSLTLTSIPRSSSGPLIFKLITFLNLLATQERDILDLHGPPSRRQGPGTTALRGLRHLTLKFEPPPMAEDGWSTGAFDAEELLRSGDKPFSFFDEADDSATHVSDNARGVDKPYKIEAEKMQDVMEHIKAHRGKGRAEYERNGYRISKSDEHLYWTGTLQVVIKVRTTDVSL